MAIPLLLGIAGRPQIDRADLKVIKYFNARQRDAELDRLDDGVYRALET